MPLFFCISGFVTMYSCCLTNNSNANDYLKYIWRKFGALIIPYLLWSLIIRPVSYHWSLQYAIYSSLISNTSYWFLPCLFVLLLLFVLWQFLTKKRNSYIVDTIITIIWGCLLCALYQITKYDLFRSVISYIVPFFMGIFMARYKGFDFLITDNKRTFIISLLAFCFVSTLYCNIDYGFLKKVCRLSSGLLSIPVLFYFFKHVHMPSRLSYGFEMLGMYTLCIYVMHEFFIISLPFQNDELNIFSQIIIFGSLSVLLSIFCALFAKFIERFKLLSFLLLGKDSCRL